MILKSFLLSLTVFFKSVSVIAAILCGERVRGGEGDALLAVRDGRPNPISSLVDSRLSRRVRGGEGDALLAVRDGRICESVSVIAALLRERVRGGEGDALLAVRDGRRMGEGWEVLLLLLIDGHLPISWNASSKSKDDDESD